MGHKIGFSITLGMLTAVIVFVGWSSRKRRGVWYKKYGPLICVLIAFPLILIDPMRHLLADYHVWEDASMYRDDCDTEDMRCLSTIGWITTIACTYTGFIFLMIGTMWQANIIQKIRQLRARWRQLRGKQVN